MQHRRRTRDKNYSLITEPAITRSRKRSGIPGSLSSPKDDLGDPRDRLDDLSIATPKESRSQRDLEAQVTQLSERIKLVEETKASYLSPIMTLILEKNSRYGTQSRYSACYHKKQGKKPRDKHRLNRPSGD